VWLSNRRAGEAASAKEGEGCAFQARRTEEPDSRLALAASRKGAKSVMIFGLPTFTFVHVLISLAGIFSGFVVLFGLLTAKRLDGWTAVFLTTTVATSVSGFFLPADRFLPSHGVGILSLLVLPVAIFARYGRHLAGTWRPIYVVTAMIALYLNVFVLIVQLFLKVPALKAIAPTQSEAPFVMAQSVALLLFVVLAIVAAIRFRTEPAHPV